jgi:alanyl-tRNA synthetase
MNTEIQKAVEVLRQGGVVLYPTDTVWGIGCDATNPEAVAKVYAIKKREDSKSLVLLASGADDKVQLVAMASKSAVAAGVKCGNVIKQAATMCGGGGGGRPDMAQAGGKNVAAIDEMLTKVPEML